MLIDDAMLRFANFEFVVATWMCFRVFKIVSLYGTMVFAIRYIDSIYAADIQLHILFKCK